MTNSANPAPAQFKPTPEMITAAEALFLAIAYEQTVRPVVEGYQRKILAERRWEVDPERQAASSTIEHVTDIKSAWLMNDVAFAAYGQRCNEERIAAKLFVQSDEFCPLLVAEDMTRVAKTVLIDAMTSITSIRSDDPKLLLDDRAKLVDITLKLLVPFVKPLLPKPHK